MTIRIRIPKSQKSDKSQRDYEGKSTRGRGEKVEWNPGVTEKQMP